MLKTLEYLYNTDYSFFRIMENVRNKKNVNIILTYDGIKYDHYISFNGTIIEWYDKIVRLYYKNEILKMVLITDTYHMILGNSDISDMIEFISYYNRIKSYENKMF